MMRHNQPEKLGSLGSDVWRLTQSNSYHTWLWETALYNNTCIASLYVKKPKRNPNKQLVFVGNREKTTVFQQCMLLLPKYRKFIEARSQMVKS